MAGKTPLAVRFWAKVDKTSPDGCWLWKAGRNKQGYGTFWNAGHNLRANRVAWILTNGDPGKLNVLHTCDNPPCVNPFHLFLGTQSENALDSVKKGRFVDNTGEKCGAHKLTLKQVREILTSNLSSRKIAVHYSVSQSCISFIKIGKNWAKALKRGEHVC